MISWGQEAVDRLSGNYCCRNDRCLTLESDVAELSGLLGYSAEEIKSTYNNSLLELVNKEAREGLQQKLREQLSVGDDVELVFDACHKNGKGMWLLKRAHRIYGDNGQEYLCGILVDITGLKYGYDEEKKKTYVLKQQAERDSLTQIYNAQTARKLSEQYLVDSEEGTKCALLIIDLDDFKQVNDRYGHMFGDEVLVEAAQVIRKLFRSKDIVGRIGGEEFLVLMKDVGDRDIVNLRCHQLNTAFHGIYRDRLSGNGLSCSIGAAFSPQHGTTYYDLFRCADEALYQAKGLGKDRYVFYNSEQV